MFVNCLQVLLVTGLGKETFNPFKVMSGFATVSTKIGLESSSVFLSSFKKEQLFKKKIKKQKVIEKMEVNGFCPISLY